MGYYVMLNNLRLIYDGDRPDTSTKASDYPIYFITKTTAGGLNDSVKITIKLDVGPGQLLTWAMEKLDLVFEEYLRKHGAEVSALNQTGVWNFSASRFAPGYVPTLAEQVENISVKDQNEANELAKALAVMQQKLANFAKK